MSAAHTVANDDQLERFSGIVHSKKEWHLQVLSEKDPLVKWGLDEGLFIQSTDRSGQSVEEAVDGAWGLTYALKDEAQALKDNLSAFCKAARRKKDWYLKLLDSEQDLAQKWTIEAGLLPNIPEGPVLDIIQELKSEAKRIKAIDHDAIELQTRLEPPRLTENWYNATQQDILRRIRYATNSEYGIRAPELKEDVGALVSDGLVPDALHAELVRELDLLAAKEPKDFHPGTFGKVQDLIHPSLYPYIAGYSDVLPNASTPMPSLTSAESFGDKDLNPQAFESEMTVNDQDIVFQSRYAWIPTVFSVNKEGTDVHLQSYINGIGPREEHPDLYRLLEKVFLLILPQLEKTLQISADYDGYRNANSSQRRWQERKELDGATEQQWNDLLARQKAEKEEEAEQIRNIDHETEEERKRWFSTDRDDEPDATLEEPSSGWKGKDLKIIVKAANYILRPGQEYSGTWHIEGMPHERVAASAIYYYDTNESTIDDGLSLRRFRHSEDDFPQQEELRHEDFGVRLMRPNQEEDKDYDTDEDSTDNYPSDWEDQEPEIYCGISKPMWTTEISPYVNLGTIKTTGVQDSGTGRILTFPNWIQHKVKGVRHAESESEDSKAMEAAESVATRKILCFFLVDDQELEDNSGSYHALEYPNVELMSVLTTSDIPCQKRSINRATLHYLLPFIAKRLGKQLDGKQSGKEFPPELVDLVWEFYDAEEKKLSRAEAEQHRRHLMEDRKMNTTKESVDGYSLYEH